MDEKIDFDKIRNTIQKNLDVTKYHEFITQYSYSVI